jgi:hypothetical protein
VVKADSLTVTLQDDQQSVRLFTNMPGELGKQHATGAGMPTEFHFLPANHATFLPLIMFWAETNRTSFYVLPEVMALERGHKFQRQQINTRSKSPESNCGEPIVVARLSKASTSM